MGKDKLLQLLAKPMDITVTDAHLLSQMLSDYPYFQPSYFLLLKYHKSISPLQYSNLLNKYILHIYNKEFLQLFLKNNNLPDNSSGTIQHVNKIKKEKKAPETLSNNHEQTTTNIIKKDIDDIKDSIVGTLKNALEDENRNIEQALFPNIELELDKDIEIIKPTIADLSLSELANRNFSDQTVLLLDEDSPNKKFINNSLNIDENPALPQNNNYVENDPSDQFMIIDKFLEKLPNLKPRPIDETIPEGDISKNSVAEHDDFMTETLARIFLKQKNYDKAIEIYNKLILKFPEKNTYFASQIAEIEKLKK